MTTTNRNRILISLVALAAVASTKAQNTSDVPRLVENVIIDQ